MFIRLRHTVLAMVFASLSIPVSAQLVVGREDAPARYNRLDDLAARGPSTFAPASPNVFGTAAVFAGVTFYDARFRRVAAADRQDPAVLALAEPLRGLAPEDQLAAIHAAVLQRVRWSNDLDNMRVADFWQNAGETLQRGTGDAEDIAIVQMQALKAAGFNPRDLYISIGRHRTEGSHIVLLARTPSGFYMLDHRASAPIAAGGAGTFIPVLTLGQGKSWVHGRRIAAPRTTIAGGANAIRVARQ